MKIKSFLISTVSIVVLFSSADAYVASPRKVIQRYLGIDEVVNEVNKIQEQLWKLKSALENISALKSFNTSLSDVQINKPLRFLPVEEKL